MGIVLRFPRHARASAVSSAGALKPNTTGSAFCSDFASACENVRKFSDGIEPRAFQLLTADVPTPANDAAAAEPPNASMMASTDLSIPHEYSRSVNLSTVHETAVDCDARLRFKIYMRESLKSLGNRLTVTREALGLKAADLCKVIKCKPNRWSQYETGERKITMEIAHRLCDEYGLTLDWIYRANPAMLPHQIRIKIRTAA